MDQVSNMATIKQFPVFLFLKFHPYGERSDKNQAACRPRSLGSKEKGVLHLCIMSERILGNSLLPLNVGSASLFGFFVVLFWF